MKEKLYRCKNCGFEEWFPQESKVWCPCKPRVKNKMIMVDEELQKIMKEEKKINKIFIKD